MWPCRPCCSEQHRWQAATQSTSARAGEMAGAAKAQAARSWGSPSGAGAGATRGRGLGCSAAAAEGSSGHFQESAFSTGLFSRSGRGNRVAPGVASTQTRGLGAEGGVQAAPPPAASLQKRPEKTLPRSHER